MSATDPVPCDFCGAPIAAGQICQGKAVVILKKKILPKCMQKALRRARRRRPPRRSPPPGSAPPRSPPRSEAHPTADRRRARLRPLRLGGRAARADDAVRQGRPPERAADSVLPRQADAGENPGRFQRRPDCSAKTLLQKGQLQVLSALEVREARGGLDPQDVIARMTQATEKAVSQGYDGLRILCDMNVGPEQPARFRPPGRLRSPAGLARGRAGAARRSVKYNVYRFELGPLPPDPQKPRGPAGQGDGGDHA
jgi:ribosomal protein L24E